MRKVTVILAALSLGLSQISYPLRADDDNPATFFMKDREYWSKGMKAPEKDSYSWAGSLFNTDSFRNETMPANRAHVVKMIEDKTRKEIGQNWVRTAVSLARVESRFNCNATGPRTRHGRAKGVFQVMPASAKALGYDYGRLHNCEHGVSAGIAHMKSCINSGVRTHNEMAKCHVAGVKGWNTKLSRNAERYKAQYVRLAARY